MYKGIHNPTKTESYFQAIFGKLQEFTRDLTGLGNPFVLGLLGLLVLGFSADYVTLVTLWIANEVICSAIKYYYFQPRPQTMPYSNWLEKIEAGSFPSIHSSRWSVFAFFVLLQGYTTVAASVLLVLMLVVGWTRFVLRKHYWRDIVAGWIIGFLFAWVASALV